MADDKPDRNLLQEDQRIDSLQSRIERAHQEELVRTGQHKSGVDENYRLGNRVLADLIAGVGGGLLIGWVLDRLFDTSPWLLLLFLFLGIGAAFRNIWKLSSGGSRKPEGE